MAAVPRPLRRPIIVGGASVPRSLSTSRGLTPLRDPVSDGASTGGASTLRGARGPRGARQDYSHELGRKSPGNGIDSAVLRLGLQRLHDAVENDVAARALLTFRGIALDANFRAVRRPGRKGRGDDFYALWTARYVEMCAMTSRPEGSRNPPTGFDQLEHPR